MPSKQKRAASIVVPKVAIYCRVSTLAQEEDGTSLDTQEERCRHYAIAQGYQVSEQHVYRETYSGAELWERPRLTLMRQALRQGDVQGVVAYAIDRLSRDPVHLGVIISEADYHGAQVEFVTEPIDKSPEGQLIRFVRGYAAQVEREKIRERALRGKLARVQSGKIHNHGRELYGFRRDHERGVRVLYEPEAAIARMIFAWYLDDRLGIRTIVRRLNDLAIPAPSLGKVTYADPSRTPRWGHGQVRRVLTEPAYKGETIEWRHEGLGIRPEAAWIRLPEGTTPAIVDLADWEGAQERIRSNKGADARNKARPYLLRGMVVCEVCGRPMRASAERDGYGTYRCSSRETPSGPCGGKRVPATMVETEVWEGIVTRMRDPALMVRELRKVLEEGPDRTLLADREAVQRHLATLEKQQARLMRVLRETDDALLPWDLLKRELAQIEQEKQQLHIQADKIEKRLAAQRGAIDRLTSVTTYCQRAARGIEAFDFTEKRTLLETLDVTVIANGRHWHLRGSIPEEEPAGVITTTSGGYGQSTRIAFQLPSPTRGAA
jgi:site-specific DNA recombinase